MFGSVNELTFVPVNENPKRNVEIHEKWLYIFHLSYVFQRQFSVQHL